MPGVHSISVPSNSVGQSQGPAPMASAQPISLHKITMICAPVLNRRAAGSHFDFKEINMLPAGDPTVYHTDGK